MRSCDFGNPGLRWQDDLAARHLVGARHRDVPRPREPFRAGPVAQPVSRFASHPHRPRRARHATGHGKMADKGALPVRRPPIPAGLDGDGMEKGNAGYFAAFGHPQG